MCPRSISVWHELETVHLIEVFQLFEVITVLRVQQVTPYTMQSCHPCWSDCFPGIKHQVVTSITLIINAFHMANYVFFFHVTRYRRWILLECQQNRNRAKISPLDSLWPCWRPRCSLWGCRAGCLPALWSQWGGWQPALLQQGRESLVNADMTWRWHSVEWQKSTNTLRSC